jgi:hypothetical protein
VACARQSVRPDAAGLAGRGQETDLYDSLYRVTIQLHDDAGSCFIFFLIKDYKSGLYVHKWTYTANDYNGVLKLQAL